MTALNSKPKRKSKPDLDALEQKAQECQLAMNRNSGLEHFELFRSRYAAVLHQVARLRPLSVYELSCCGLRHSDAVEVASVTGGARTDKGENCRTIHPKLKGATP